MAAKRPAILLKTEKSQYRLELKDTLLREAQQWSYALRNRFRWITDDSQRTEQDKRSCETALSIGMDKATLAQIAKSALVRVVFDREALGAPGAIDFPWEYILSAATRASRQGRRFVVVRHIEDGTAVKPRRSSSVTALLVESAPNPLRRHFNFEAESRLVRASFEGSPVDAPSAEKVAVKHLTDPTRADLARSIRELAPTVVHLAGIDAHQSARMLKWADDTGDGVILKGQDGGPVIELASRFADLVTAADVPPELVVANFYNTGQNLARLVVERGAGAALGYFDEFDDSAAEWLVAGFYARWKDNGGDAAAALADALTNLRDRGAQLEGTGVVVWTREPPQRSARTQHVTRALTMPASPLEPADTLSNVPLSVVNVDARVCPGLNYALLRNDKDLFLTFRLRNLSEKRIGDIRVEVTLRVGHEQYPFQGMFDIDEPVHELRDLIRVPLPATAGLVIRENTQAVIHSRVHAGEALIHEATAPVTLQSVDEWQLDAESLPWLPAFVFPRDNAIERVLDLASRYIRVITENASFGFPGYQPTGTLTTSQGVDAQAWAIWAAIAYDIEPSYISPLPGGGLRAQRLRVPRDTLGYKRGTCVDLALLFAACLEYVEINPVIFLFDGHACAGYWRDHNAHAQFCRAQLPEEFNLDLIDHTMPVSSTSWVVERACLHEVRRYIAEDHLAPVETQLLSERKSLMEARLNAQKRTKEITAVIDIALARAQGVSSLPLPP